MTYERGEYNGGPDVYGDMAQVQHTYMHTCTHLRVYIYVYASTRMCVVRKWRPTRFNEEKLS